MASIEQSGRAGKTPTHRGSGVSGGAKIAIAVAGLAIAVMVLGSLFGILSGNDDVAPAAMNDGAPVIGVNDPNIVVEESSGAEVAPLTPEAQGSTMTTVPTTPVDETE
jgi:hypothetical protein